VHGNRLGRPRTSRPALGGEAVHVFSGAYTRDQGHRVEPLGERKLDKKAKDRRIAVQTVYEGGELSLGDSGVEAVHL
jgi:hypothetical protein